MDEQELMDRAARRAESRSEFIASAVARYRDAMGLDNGQIAAQLGIGTEALASLMLCERPRLGSQYAPDLADIAQAYDADEDRLATVLLW